MKKIFIPLFLLCALFVQGQQFISTGMIEFEVVANNHKQMGDEDNFWTQMFKDKTPKLSTSWYRFMFNDNKAVYKFDRKDEKSKLPWDNGAAEDNTWYNDYTANTFIDYKFIVDNNYLLTGELMKIDWKLSPGENRVIAGFNCRKATGVIFDSVYVFAFYTDEITISGGPMGLHGLPGMILGVTIPRMYTSWVATKLQVANVDTKKIVPPQKGKKKQASELTKAIETAMEGRGSWLQQSLWGVYL